MRNIPNRTLALIGFLITLTVVLLGIALYASSSKKAPFMTKILQNPTPTVPKTAVVSFSPANLSIPVGSSPSATVDIITSTGENPITGAQIEIDYDPQVITNVQVLPATPTTSLLGASYTTLFTDSKTPGKLVFANGISTTATPATGTGSVGKISFNVVRGSQTTTTLTFGPQTKITTSKAQGSVLQSTTPLVITLQ